MKFITASGKKTISLKKSEWISMGKVAGWIKSAEEVEPEDPAFMMPAYQNILKYVDTIGKLLQTPGHEKEIEQLLFKIEQTAQSTQKASSPMPATV